MTDYNQYLHGPERKYGVRNYTEVSANEAVIADINRGYFSQCGTCGAIIPHSNRTQHNNFHATFSNRKDQTMSNVSWCDYGNHAFKAGEPGSVHFDGALVEDDGKAVNQSMDACAQHNPIRVRPDVIVKELESEFPVNGGIAD